MMIGHEHKGKRLHAKYTLFILGNNDHMCLIHPVQRGEHLFAA